MKTIATIRSAFAGAACLAALSGGGALAQDEVQTFNAFAVIAANGTIVRAAEKQVMVAGSLAGPFFIETDEGPIHSGHIACVASVRVDQATLRQTGDGACTFTAHDGATAWGDWQCAGYELIGCRGAFKLSGGTARLAGASGEASMIWRPSAHELRRQLDGSTLDNATGILLWRDFKLKSK